MYLNKTEKSFSPIGCSLKILNLSAIAPLWQIGIICFKDEACKCNYLMEQKRKVAKDLVPQAPNSLNVVFKD